MIMALISIAAVVLLVLCVTRMYEINERSARLKAENQQLLQQKQALEDKNNQIIAQGAHGNDSIYVENVAREQLDMVYPGEVVFRTTGG